MIKETGAIIQISEEKAKVLIPRNAACEGCHSCHSNSDGFGMIAEVSKVQGLGIGDRVILEGKEVNQVKGGLLIFILPLVLLFIGYLIGEAVSKGAMCSGCSA
jgi:sigma-E factor negative regulatory protein RseC